MSNYGLQKFFLKEKIKFLRSRVGDRYVKEVMKKNKFNLGGEQSGHIILGKFATTGDGLLVALEILFALRKGKIARYSQTCSSDHLSIKSTCPLRPPF